MCFRVFLNKEYDNYYTVFSESVIGLYNDAQVKLNGIDVGNVTGIEIDSANLNQVIVRFRVNKGTPIKIGTRAGMTHGISLTGEKQIVLSGGRFDEPDVQEGGFVPAEKTAFDAIANKATDIIGHVDSLMTNLNRSVPTVMGNVNGITGNLNGASSDITDFTASLKQLPLDSTMKTLNATLANLQALSEQLNDKNSTLGKVMNDRELYDNANHAIASLDSLLTDIKAHPKRYINVKVF